MMTTVHISAADHVDGALSQVQLLDGRVLSRANLVAEIERRETVFKTTLGNIVTLNKNFLVRLVDPRPAEGDDLGDLPPVRAATSARSDSDSNAA